MRQTLIAVGFGIVFSLFIFTSCKKKNNAPEIPTTPAGPETGMINTSYSFSSSAIDLEDEKVAIRFAWGDGDTSNWSGFVASGETTSMSHSWSIADT
jgi:hypothetical protein